MTGLTRVAAFSVLVPTTPAFAQAAHGRIAAIQSHWLSNRRFPEALMPRLIWFPLALTLAIAAPVATQEASYTLMIKDHTLMIKDHKFQPTEIEIPAGQKIALIIKNNDSMRQKNSKAPNSGVRTVVGGDQSTVYIGPLKPGIYEFFGDFNPTTARGHIIAK